MTLQSDIVTKYTGPDSTGQTTELIWICITHN